MNKIFLVLVLALLAGCAAQRLPVEQPQLIPLPAEQTLWRMRLGEEETGFTALLGLRWHDQVLDMVVLDPSGFKLFEGTVDRRGELLVRFVLPMVRDRGLPEYLAASCQRIFLVEPEQLPCSGTWFGSLCLLEDRGVIRKIARRALFPVWEVAYYREKDKAELSGLPAQTKLIPEGGNPLAKRIIMQWSWFRPPLTLERL